MSTSLRPSFRIEVPEDAYSGDVPLAATLRGDYVNALYRGVAAMCTPDGETIVALGDAGQPAFLRSAAKPFQVMPAILSGGVDRFGITERELAVLCASHIAEPRHMDAVLSVLGKIGLGEEHLRCGIHPPIHEPTARDRARRGIEPSPVCNNCSGAHAGQLVACRAEGWPVDDYGNPGHPLQVWIRRIVAAFAGLEDVPFAVDNCAIPTFRVPVDRGAVMFARLATGEAVPSDLSAAAARVVAAMTRHPGMVGGEGRFDTVLMSAAGGSVVAKGGAEAFQGIGISPERLGLAVKISSGAAAASVVALRLLSDLGLMPAQRDGLQPFIEPEIYNHQGALVGRMVPLIHVERGA